MQWDFVNHLKCLTVNRTCLTVNSTYCLTVNCTYCLTVNSTCLTVNSTLFYPLIIIFYYHGSHCIIHNTTALRIE